MQRQRSRGEEAWLDDSVRNRDDTTIIIDGKIFIDKLTTIIDKNRFLSIF